MNTIKEQLEWIVRFAMWSDAAMAEDFFFIGANKIEELHPTVIDELEITSLNLTTQSNTDNIRTFGFDRDIDDKVQKVFGIEFSNARDCGTSGDNICAEFSLSKTKQLGPNICAELLSLIEVTCRVEMRVDMLDGHPIILGIIGTISSLEFRAIDHRTSETEIQSVTNSTVQKLQALAKLCEKSENYVPFDDLISQ